ncbi:MAG: sulfotransferase [Anaerolineales bacterium]|jgi:hypothetical protein
MDFNFSLFFAQIKHTLFASAGTPARLSPKRIRFLLLFFPVFAIIKLSNTLGFLLDDLVFNEFKQTEISEPVFILGNLRSGTTYLHRLLAKDQENFTYMRFWEIIFGHSIFQRKFFWKLKEIDDRLGGFFQKLIRRLEAKTWFSNPIHRMGLQNPHEDEGLLMGIWESINTSIFFPHLDLVEKYALFDKRVSSKNRRRIMQFYKACVKRHLFAHQGAKKYLSKSPAFSPKIDTLLENFPNAKIIYLVRNPLKVIPSLISWMSFQWSRYIDWPERYIYHDYLIELAREWYQYPLNRLDRAPEARYVIVNYDDLVANPKNTIAKIYDHFGFEISPDFQKILDLEVERERNYRSKHKYSLAELDLSKKRILETFRFVFQRFKFETN